MRIPAERAPAAAGLLVLGHPPPLVPRQGACTVTLALGVQKIKRPLQHFGRNVADQLSGRLACGQGANTQAASGHRVWPAGLDGPGTQMIIKG